MLKRFKYTFLIMTAAMLSYTSIYSQITDKDFRGLLYESYEYIKSDPEKAVDLVTKAYKKVENSDNEYLKMIGYMGMGYVSYNVRDYEAAYINYSEALIRMEELDTLDLFAKVTALKHMGMIHSKFNNHDESIEYRRQSWDAMKLFNERYPEIVKEKKAETLLRDIPYFLAVEYEKKGSHQTAGKILMDLWQQAEDKEDVVTHARVLNKLGLIKKNNGEYAAAQEFLGLVISEKDVSDKRQAIAYHNLAETYMLQGDLSRAENLYLIALDIKKGLNNSRSTFLTYKDLGELVAKRGNTQAAIDFWEKGLSIFDDVQGEPELYDIYNSLQVAYMDIDVAKAKEFNQIHKKLNDFYVRNQSFQREEEAQRRDALSALIDQERQRRIDADSRERFIQQFWPVFLGVGLLVLFSMILGIRYYMALRANRVLSKTQLKLERAKEIIRSAETDLD